MGQHTPGPWRLHDMERATIVAGRPGGEVANCLNGFGDQEANAHFIAHAVNCHADLLYALRAAERWVAQYEGTTGHAAAARSMLNVIRPVLAKADPQADRC